MIQLNIVVEGQTEESFVKRLLVPHLGLFGVSANVRRVMTKQDKKREDIRHRGGGNFAHYVKDINLWIDSNRFSIPTWFTTMIDLYAFPTDATSPYLPSIQAMTDPYYKVVALEQAIADRLQLERFIPYVQLHEFEALVLCDAQRLNQLFPDSRAGVRLLCKEIESLEPERINEGANIAPSKRIEKYIQAYKTQKVAVGVAIVEDIGLPLLRKRCPHFNDWISRLEQLGVLLNDNL